MQNREARFDAEVEKKKFLNQEKSVVNLQKTENIESETEKDLLDVITPTDSVINSEIGAISALTDKKLSGPSNASNASDFSDSSSTSQSGGAIGDEECLTSKRRLSFSGAAIKR